MYPITANAALVRPGEIAAYLGMLFNYVDWGDRGYELRGIGEKGTAQEGSFRGERFFLADGAADQVARHATRWGQWHIATYIVPAVLDAAAREQHKASEDHVCELTTLLVDLDHGDIDAKQAWLTQYVGPPTMVVASGGVTPDGVLKRHLYWLLTEPSAEVARVAALRERLAIAVGDDRSFKRMTQVVRVPGTVHAKGGVVGLCCIMEHMPGREYELDDLAERIEAMPAMPGSVPERSGTAGTLPLWQGHGPMDFSAGAGFERPNPFITDIHEGGSEADNRWSRFNYVAGSNIAEVRKGSLTLTDAVNNTRGWMLNHMVPPWPEERFRTEFVAVFRKDERTYGPMPAMLPRQGALPPPALPSFLPGGGVALEAPPSRSRPIVTIDDLNEWSVHRWAGGARRRRRFLVDKLLLAGMPQMLAASGGVGKTFLMLDLGLKLAASDEHTPLRWLGEQVTADAWGGTVVILTAEDDADEIQIRLHDIDPHGLRFKAGDRFKVVPLINAGGPFPLVSVERGQPGPSQKWAAMMDALRQIPNLIMVGIDTLSATLHGEDISAAVMQQYVNEASRVCGELGAALLVSGHLRKAGRDAIRDADDMREAIRGSGAITASMRGVIGVWQAHDWKVRLKAMGRPPEKDMLYRAAVVKANNPEMLKEMKTLYRGESGLLEDVSESDALTHGPSKKHAAWLIKAIELAAEARHPFTRTSRVDGLYSRRSSLPPEISWMSRDALQSLAQQLLDRKLIVQGALVTGGKSHDWLDVPHGPIPKHMGGRDSGVWQPDWSRWYFDEAMKAVFQAS